jgi:hypothetical protein
VAMIDVEADHTNEIRAAFQRCDDAWEGVV